MTVVQTDPVAALTAQTVLTVRPEKAALTLQKAEIAAAAEVLTRTAVKVVAAQPAEVRKEAANAVLLATAMTVAASAALATVPLLVPAVKTAVAPVAVTAPTGVVSEKKASPLTAQTVAQAAAAMTAEKEPATEKEAALTAAMTGAVTLPAKTGRFLETETKPAENARPAEKATDLLTAAPRVRTVAVRTVPLHSSAVMTVRSVPTAAQSVLTALTETAKDLRKAVLAVQMKKPRRLRPIT